MSDRSHDFVILGLGPVGAIIAGHLVNSGIPMIAVERQPIKRTAMSRAGIQIRGFRSIDTQGIEIHPTLTRLNGTAIKFLFVAVKAFQNHSVIEALNLIKPQPSWLICCQNGLDVEAPFIKQLGNRRVLRMVVNFAGNQIGSSCFRMNFFAKPNYLGGFDGHRRQELEPLLTVLTECRLDTQWVDDIQPWIWRKLICNLAFSATTALTRLTVTESIDRPEAVELASAIIEESSLVAKASGIELPPDFTRIVLGYLATSGNHRPSLAIDLRKGNETEIDYLHGKVANLGDRYGIPTPTLKAVVNLVKLARRKISQYDHSLHPPVLSMNGERAPVPAGSGEEAATSYQSTDNRHDAP